MWRDKEAGHRHLLSVPSSECGHEVGLQDWIFHLKKKVGFLFFF